MKDDILYKRCENLTYTIKTELLCGKDWEDTSYEDLLNISKKSGIKIKKIAELMLSPDFISNDLLSLTKMMKLLRVNPENKISVQFSGSQNNVIPIELTKSDSFFGEVLGEDLLDYDVEGLKLAMGEEIVDIMKRNYLTKQSLSLMLGEDKKLIKNTLDGTADCNLFNMVKIGHVVGEYLVFKVEK